ncbi:MAG: MATE family efflux transporter [Polyangiaceae bacterium]
MTTPPPADERPGFVATVREALRGTTSDLTAIPIRRAVVLLAVPTVLEMSMESLLTIVDIFFVSRLGANAVAVVGLTESILSLLYAVAMGLSAAATALVSRKTGEHDGDGAARAAVQVVGLALVLSVLFGGAGSAFAPTLLAAAGAEPSVIAEGATYTRVMFGGSFTIFVLFVLNAVFRSAGDATVAMRSLWIANSLNILLCPAFLFGVGPVPRMGVVGAAFAMTLSRGVGIGYLAFVLARKSTRFALARKHLVVVGDVVREILRIATTGSLQVLIETASWLGLVRILAAYGSAALAGYTIAMRIAVFALLPSWGLASAAATLVGQNLGAKRPDRAESSVRTIALYNLVFLGGVGVVLACNPGSVTSLFTAQPVSRELAADCLRVVALGFVFFAFGMVVVQSFNGAGDTKTPMLVNLGCFWFFKIPLAWTLANPLHLGAHGVFLAITAAYSLQAIVGGALFRRGRWKTVSVGAS